MSSKVKKKQKVVKELYGTMFEIRTNRDGKKEAVPTKDPNKAVDIVIPKGEKRCPNKSCGTDKCLDNIVGETLVFPEYYRDAVEGSHIRFLDIAECKNSGKDFLIARSLQLSHLDKGICVWCGSPYIEKISNLEEVRKSFFLPASIKKYKWVVWEDWDHHENSGFFHTQMEGMTIDESNIFLFKEPWRCKHCKRIFGYEIDREEGRALFRKLIEEVRKRELGEYLKKIDISEQMLAIDCKCPFCSCEINYDKWFLDCLPWSDENPGFTIQKYKCGKCDKEFFVWSDDYLLK